MSIDSLTTSVNLSPMIKQSFDPFLLMTTLQRKMHLLKYKIMPLAMKKLSGNHPCIGKQREFEKLYDKFMELYVRKETKEAEYKAENQKKMQERPRYQLRRALCI